MTVYLTGVRPEIWAFLYNIHLSSIDIIERREILNRGLAYDASEAEPCIGESDAAVNAD